MKVKMAVVLAFLISSFSAVGNIEPVETTALSMVPRGILIANIAREYFVKTKAGTKIKVEFGHNGKFEEASGMNLNHGDEFEPGMGLISLGTAARSVVRIGYPVRGDWNLEKDSTHGWVYEMAGESNDEEIFHLVNATSGQFIGSIAEKSPQEFLGETKLAKRN
jgi:hypothetical protein